MSLCFQPVRLSEVIVPGSLVLVFSLKVSGHANKFLVQNVSRALVDKFVVKFSGTILQDSWLRHLQNLRVSFPF